MKKFLLTMAVAIFSLAAMAQEQTTRVYTDQLSVSVDGVGSTMNATVEVEMLEDNYINFLLKNFVLVMDGDDMPVGNIEIKNLFTQNKGDYSTFSYNANIRIKEGDAEGYDTWVGPDLENVPLVLKGKMSDDKLYVTIDIDMKSLEQIIAVKFGEDFPAPSVQSTKEFKAKLTSIYTSTDEEDYGEVMPLIPTEEYAVALSSLSNGNVQLLLKGMAIVAEGEEENEVIPIGDAVITDVDVITRGDYNDFAFTGNVDFVGEEGTLVIPVVLKGKYNDANLYFTLKLADLTAMEIPAFIDYVYGEDFAPAVPVGGAKEYSDKIVVTVNESTTPEIPATVSVTPLTNGGINFSLKNFTLLLDGDEAPVGNISIEDLKLYDGPGYKYFDYTGNLLVEEGDDASVDFWMGPGLGEIPLRLRGRVTDEKLCVYIDIDMESLNQLIYVQFGQPIEAEEETAISSVAQTASKASAIYDLSGRQVSAARRGIYIVGGKKVVK